MLEIEFGWLELISIFIYVVVKLILVYSEYSSCLYTYKSSWTEIAYL